MPVGVNTELYSGLQQLRGVKTPEPEDVAEAIVEALQTGRYEVYVPKRMNATLRISSLLPLQARDALSKATGGDVVIAHPDHAARAAYEARIAQTMAATGTPEPTAAPEPAVVDPEPEAEREAETV